jgi:hypothetical protein
MMSIEKTLEFHYYTQPTFFILSPSTGPVFGTSIITVTGDSLLCRMGCSCTFGKTQVQALQSGSEITCAIAGVEEGIVSMDIALNGKDFTRLSKSFEWRRPMQCLENVPSSGPSSGGYLVTIVGSDFPNTEFSCMFSEIEQRQLQLAVYHSSSKISCVAPVMSGMQTYHISILDFQTRTSCRMSSRFFMSETLLKISTLSQTSGPLSGGNIVAINIIEKNVNLVCIWHILGSTVKRDLIFSDTLPLSGMGCEVPRASQETEALLELVDRQSIIIYTFSYLFQNLPEVRVCLPSQMISGISQAVTVFGSFRNSPTLTCKMNSKILTGTFVSGSMIICHMTIKETGQWALEVSNNGADFSRDGIVVSFFDPHTVAVFSLQPSQGPDKGQGVVIIKGWGWNSDADVGCVFGGFYFTATHKGTTSAITCIVPRLDKHMRGSNTNIFGLSSFEVQVQISINGILVHDTFRYSYLPEASISSVIPSLGSIDGGETIRIVGTGFASGPVLRCRFREGSGSVFSDDSGRWESSSIITCVTPKRTEEGTVAIDLSNNDQYFTTDKIMFSFVLPARIDFVFPQKGPSTEESWIIRGLNFIDSPKLSCSRITDNFVVRISSSILTCRLYPKGTGNTTIEISNNGEDFSRQTMSFEFFDMSAVYLLRPAIAKGAGEKAQASRRPCNTKTATRTFRQADERIAQASRRPRNTKTATRTFRQAAGRNCCQRLLTEAPATSQTVSRWDEMC